MAKTLLAIAALLVGAQAASADWTAGRGFDFSHNKTIYQDSDWNVAFYANCELPEHSSVQWVREDGEHFLRFTLKNGQVGGCRSDPRRRHRAPYWERAELKQTHTLEMDRDYSLTYRVRFLKGFDNDREDFLQVHQSVKGCRGGPRIMVKFSGGRLERSWLSPVRIDDIRGKWINVRFDFKAAESYAVYFDGKPVIDMEAVRNPLPCGEPHLKIEIYRPGDDKATGDRLSVMDIDKVRLVDR